MVIVYFYYFVLISVIPLYFKKELADICVLSLDHVTLLPLFVIKKKKKKTSSTVLLAIAPVHVNEEMITV